MATTPAPPLLVLMPRWLKRALVIFAALVMCLGAASGQDCQSGLGAECDTGCVACACPPGWPVGPSDEYLCDGGDAPSPAGMTTTNEIAGLEQEATVGAYTTEDGRTFVVPSTRTCSYAPRFGAVRQVVLPMGAEQRVFVDAFGDAFAASEAAKPLMPGQGIENLALQGQRGQRPPSLFRARQQAGATERMLGAAETRGLVGPYANLQLVHLGRMDGRDTPLLIESTLSAITWTGDQEVQITITGEGAKADFAVQEPGLIYELQIPDSPRLRLVKLASASEAHPGDEVSFTLRFDNVGDAPMKDVVIVDNLTTRLEYVEESAESSVDAAFSTTRNGAGSLVLSWRLAEPLEPGDGGVLTFRTRVR